MQLAMHHVTSAGGRSCNEDAVKVECGTNFVLLILADGLGGHEGGALAAQTCGAAVAESFAAAPSLSDAALQGCVTVAHEAVTTLRTKRHSPRGSMRTTLAFLAICGSEARWAHVGDSRVYHFRDNTLIDRTRDHSVAELVTSLTDRSLAAPLDSLDRNRLLKAIGSGQSCQAELGPPAMALRPGDAFLLCSDGLWGLVSDTEITDSLSRSATPIDWCSALEAHVQTRLQDTAAGEHDNYSMLVLTVTP